MYPWLLVCWNSVLLSVQPNKALQNKIRNTSVLRIVNRRNGYRVLSGFQEVFGSVHVCLHILPSPSNAPQCSLLQREPLTPGSCLVSGVRGKSIRPHRERGVAVTRIAGTLTACSRYSVGRKCTRMSEKAGPMTVCHAATRPNRGSFTHRCCTTPTSGFLTGRFLRDLLTPVVVFRVAAPTALNKPNVHSPTSLAAALHPQS